MIAQFAHEQAREIADLEYFEDLVRGVIGRVAGPTMRSPPTSTERSRRSIRSNAAALRIAAYELLHRPDVPYRVVINRRSIRPSASGSEHGHTYVNGVLDRRRGLARAGSGCREEISSSFRTR